MHLNDLHPADGSHKIKRRVGRGASSGWGKTSGRGQKGQKAVLVAAFVQVLKAVSCLCRCVFQSSVSAHA